MTGLGIYWARRNFAAAKVLNKEEEWVEGPRLDIAGVASSILAAPTIRKPRKSADFRGFSIGFGWRLTEKSG